MAYEIHLGNVIQGGECLIACPVFGTPKLHQSLGIKFQKCNVSDYIQNCFPLTYAIFSVQCYLHA